MKMVLIVEIPVPLYRPLANATSWDETFVQVLTESKQIPVLIL
jgi:hypothetical protein